MVIQTSELYRKLIACSFNMNCWQVTPHNDWARGWMIQGSILAEANNFGLPYSARSLLFSGYHGFFYPVIKRPVTTVDHSPPSSSEVVNKGSYKSSLPVWLHDMDRGRFDITVTMNTATTKQDMSTTENWRRTDPNKQLGPRPYTYKKPPATVHGDNRALVWNIAILHIVYTDN
jgi:hypothetical protein